MDETVSQTIDGLLKTFSDYDVLTISPDNNEGEYGAPPLSGPILTRDEKARNHVQFLEATRPVLQEGFYLGLGRTKSLVGSPVELAQHLYDFGGIKVLLESGGTLASYPCHTLKLFSPSDVPGNQLDSLARKLKDSLGQLKVEIQFHPRTRWYDSPGYHS